MFIKNIKATYILALCLLGFSTNISAQVSPPTSMYFLNEYLYNPAFAGKNLGVSVGASYKNNLTGSNGENQANNLSLSYGQDKAGFGLILNTEKDGVLNYNKIGATYAYNLKISQTGDLRFGVSAVMAALKLDQTNVIGDLDDDLIQQYQEGGYQFNADLGVSYTDGNLALGAVLPNVRNLIDRKNVRQGFGYSKYYFSAAYKLVQGNTAIVPKVLYRGIDNMDGILDVGVNAEFNENAFNAMAMYHSNGSLSAGVGFKVIPQLNAQLAYALPLSNNMSKYTYGAIEIGLKANLSK